MAPADNKSLLQSDYQNSLFNQIRFILIFDVICDRYSVWGFSKYLSDKKNRFLYAKKQV